VDLLAFILAGFLPLGARLEMANGLMIIAIPEEDSSANHPTNALTGTHVKTVVSVVEQVTA